MYIFCTDVGHCTYIILGKGTWHGTCFVWGVGGRRHDILCFKLERWYRDDTFPNDTPPYFISRRFYVPVRFIPE
jgi:hypothetical protein